jgi:hypothetical protein
MRLILSSRVSSHLRRKVLLLSHPVIPPYNCNHVSNALRTRMQSSNAHQYYAYEDANNTREAPVHHLPRLTGCKIDTRSKTYIDSSKLSKTLVKQLNSRLNVVRKGGGEASVQKHLSRNKMLPRDRINMLIDPGTPFMELSPLAGMYSYPDQEDATLGDQMNVPSAGIVTGIGIIAGTPTMIVANDATVKGGTYHQSQSRNIFVHKKLHWKINCPAYTLSTLVGHIFLGKVKFSRIRNILDVFFTIKLP